MKSLTFLIFIVVSGFAFAQPTHLPLEAHASDRAAFPATALPNLFIYPGGETVVDPELPYRLLVHVGNAASTPATAGKVSVQFSPDTRFHSLPEGCSAGEGLVVCELGDLGPAPELRTLVLEPIAPSQNEAGTIQFRMFVASAEADSHPPSNENAGELRMFDTFYVTTVADEGEGSLRSAIHAANAACDGQPCKIAFRISSPAAKPWHTLLPASPFPPVTGGYVSIDGTTQTRFFGDTNEAGPEIELTGIDAGETADGLLLNTPCHGAVSGLVINGFGGSGIRYTGGPCASSTHPEVFSGEVTDSYLGSDPTGMIAVPNRWGIFVDTPNIHLNFGIRGNIIGGNIRSGIFAFRGNVYVSGNRIGINRDLSGPLSNGASGVYIGGGPEIFRGAGAHFSDISHNYIGFNHHFGIAIALDAHGVSIRGNSIQANWQQGIDFGLDGVTPATPPLVYTDVVTSPEIVSARWDPLTNTTVIEGLLPGYRDENTLKRWIISVYANDEPDASGYGEGQYFLGETELHEGVFTFVSDRDLRGKWIAATTTNSLYSGFAKPPLNPDAVDINTVVTATSEFSRALQVNP